MREPLVEHRLEQPGQVDELELGVAVGPDAGNRQPGCLGLRADQREVAAEDGIEEGGLAHVGATGDRDAAETGHGRKIVVREVSSDHR